jgi:hypothetical protein
VAVRPDGSLELASADLTGPRVLAAFYAEPGVGLRKHVWVVQAARP